MTHAIEAFIGGSTTRKTRDYAIRAVQLIIANIEKAYKNGQDEHLLMQIFENLHNCVYGYLLWIGVTFGNSSCS